MKTNDSKMKAHDPTSVLLIGNLDPSDTIHLRDAFSMRALC